jgi:hypothetical protein
MSITINASGLSWLGFWLFLAVLVWVSHKQFVAGYRNLFFSWDDEGELELRRAAIDKAANERTK